MAAPMTTAPSTPAASLMLYHTGSAIQHTSNGKNADTHHDMTPAGPAGDAAAVVAAGGAETRVAVAPSTAPVFAALER